MTNPQMMINYAEYYVEQGFKVLPYHTPLKDSMCSCGHKCGHAGKHPRGRNWQKMATADPEEIKRLWSVQYPGANIGVVLENHIALDIDPRNGGEDSLKKLEEELGPLPDTLRTKTGGGGSHYFFNLDNMKVRSRQIAPGVELKTGPGHPLTAPPSIHPSGNRYLRDKEGLDHPVSLPPKWQKFLEQSGNAAKSNEEVAIDLDAYNLDDRIERAKAYLEKIPGAIEGQNGDHKTLTAAAVGHDFGIPEKKWFKILLKEFNPRCEPPWDEGQLKLKVRNAYQYSKGKFGNKLGQDYIQNDLYASSLDDWWAYLVDHTYIYEPLGTTYPASSVNTIHRNIKKLEGMKPSTWLDRNRPIMQQVYAPGQPRIIKGCLFDDGGGVIEKPGYSAFNEYQPPRIVEGDPAQATRWLEHGRKLYGDDFDHIVKYFAHCVQKPQEKPNHGIVLGGSQGIGKDTLLEPLKHAVGSRNFCEISPSILLSQFNGWLKNVVARISEARDLGEVDRYKFYDHLKSYMATPPDVLRCNRKNVPECAVLNILRIIITTNYKTNGIYLPFDDRRHYVVWSDLTKDSFEQNYFTNIWNWYKNGGLDCVATYLRKLDISDFDPKAPPKKTAAWHAIVDANCSPEDLEIRDALDALGNPDAFSIVDLVSDPRIKKLNTDLCSWLIDRRNSRQIPHRMEAAGYEAIRNEAAKDGHWVRDGKRMVIYAKKTLSKNEKIRAAQNLTNKKASKTMKKY